MSIDLGAAADFLASHARMLDRRRFELLLSRADPAPVVAAVNAYRNSDGGYGCGLEPDLRSAGSQPAAALHAFEVFAEIGPTCRPEAVALCDWLATVSRPDGGLPFALPIADPAGCAPFWVQADQGSSSLQITAIVAAYAHQVAKHDPAVAGHRWLEAATRYCLAAVAALPEQPHALELAFAFRLLDAVADTHPAAPPLLARLARHVPASGQLPVAGGLPDEMMRPLDFTPDPHGPARGLFRPAVVAADLDRLADGQQADGGWAVDFASYSPAAALDWRGYTTVHAVSVLRAHSRL
ncbi:MAG TPA: hypothetical protein VNO83_05070 [Pseudonocardia sp.]|nr:hypothetical protein [Pseudonocardia sp.]